MKSTNDPRHSARVLLVQNIFQNSQKSTDMNLFGLQEIRDIDEISSFNLSLYEQILSFINANKDKLEEDIQKYLRDLNTKKVSHIDLAILKIAITESKYLKITPWKVAINEAVDLAKEFGGMDNGSFVNGILDSILKE